MPSLNHKSGLAWGSNQVLWAVRELCNHCQQQAWKRRQHSNLASRWPMLHGSPSTRWPSPETRCCQRPGRCRAEPHSGGRSGLLHGFFKKQRGDTAFAEAIEDEGVSPPALPCRHQQCFGFRHHAIDQVAKTGCGGQLTASTVSGLMVVPDWQQLMLSPTFCSRAA